MEEVSQNNKTETHHRFLDEAGDTTFFGKGKIPIIGIKEGVSLCFILGMVKFKTPLAQLRDSVQLLQQQVQKDSYFKDIHSVQKKIQNGGFYFHASDDIPEIRKIFYEYIKSIDCSFEAVNGRKIPEIYLRKHNNKEAEYYADLLSHLLKNKFKGGEKLILHIAERGNTTKNATLELARQKAMQRFQKNKPRKEITTNIVFDVQNHKTEPLLNIADYLCWAVQRVFEKGEMRYYNFIEEKVSLVVDIYDTANYEGNKHYYTYRNKLTSKNKLSPPLY
ncbi:MAG: DUF3800 domain-containing protein [Bacteroidota bacterium]|nr:DUF3800 domain-containing protein [Bacteroidota bacterium]